MNTPRAAALNTVSVSQLRTGILHRDGPSKTIQCHGGTIMEHKKDATRPRLALIPPASLPDFLRDQVELPYAVWQAISGGRGIIARVVGDSMQPGILHHDTIVVLHRTPKSGDLVCVRTEPLPDPVYGKIEMCIGRYRDGFLTKDNARYRTLKSKPVKEEDIVGVIVRIIPRECRDPFENDECIQQFRALERSLGIAPDDMGFFCDADRDLFSAVVSIPPSELIAGDLPWGYFRAIAHADQPHVDIRAGDTLTINPTRETCVGQLVVCKLENGGPTIIGGLKREGLGTKEPGEFYIDTLHDRFLTSDAYSFGVIESTARPRGGPRPNAGPPHVIARRVARKPKGTTRPRWLESSGGSNVVLIGFREEC